MVNYGTIPVSNSMVNWEPVVVEVRDMVYVTLDDVMVMLAANFVLVILTIVVLLIGFNSVLVDIVFVESANKERRIVDGFAVMPYID